MDDLTVSNREIKILSILIAELVLQDPNLLHEGFNIKGAIGNLIKDTEFLKTLSTSATKMRQIFQKLQNSEQLVNSLAGITDAKTLAQSIEGILTAIKLNNPKLNLIQIAKVLASELKRDAEQIEKAIEEFGKKSKEGEKPEAGRGLMAAVGTTGTTGTTGGTVTESFGGNQNILAETFARKLASKLIVK